MAEITPEKVAAAACEGVGGWQENLEAALSVTSQGNVLSLEVTRWAEDGTETVRHYRAPVVEGEDVPDLKAMAEVDRLRRGMHDLYARWIQRAHDNGDYYNRTGEKYENGKAVAFDAAAEEIRALIGEQGGAR